MKLTDAQVLKLRDAVDNGYTWERHHTQRRPLRRLLDLGFLRAGAEPTGTPLVIPAYYPTARGVAYMRWWSARYDKPIRPFRCPPGGTIQPYRR